MRERGGANPLPAPAVDPITLITGTTSSSCSLSSCFWARRCTLVSNLSSSSKSGVKVVILRLASTSMCTSLCFISRFSFPHFSISRAEATLDAMLGEQRVPTFTYLFFFLALRRQQQHFPQAQVNKSAHPPPLKLNDSQLWGDRKETLCVCQVKSSQVT